jgi:hypothetical protein
MRSRGGLHGCVRPLGVVVKPDRDVGRQLQNEGRGRNLLSPVRVASVSRESVAVLSKLRHCVEHVLDEGPVSWLRASMAGDHVSGVPRHVSARGLVSLSGWSGG